MGAGLHSRVCDWGPQADPASYKAVEEALYDFTDFLSDVAKELAERRA